jgi:hypothetical protein
VELSEKCLVMSGETSEKVDCWHVRLSRFKNPAENCEGFCPSSNLTTLDSL